MRHLSLIVSASVLFSLSVLAQNSEPGMHAPDGGVIEQFNSILLPPVPHAPFTSTVTAEWTKALEDGSTRTVQTHRLVVRDGAVRIYQERRRRIPRDSQHEPDLQKNEISVPAAPTKFF